MISEVDEHFAISIALEHLVSTSGDRISLKDGKEVLWGDLSAFIVNVNSPVDISSVRLVENLSWEWIFRVGCNIVIGEGDDLVCWDSIS